MEHLTFFLLLIALLMFVLNVYLTIQVIHCPEKKCTMMDWVVQQHEMQGCPSS